MSKHDRAVQKVINSRRQTHSVKEVKADLDGFPSPAPIGKENHVPDIKIKYANGKEEIVEVDTKPMSAKDKRQHRAFKRSASAKPDVRSYTHVFAVEVL